MNEEKGNPLQIIRIDEAIKLCGLAKSSYYDRIKQGLLPKQIPLGGRNVGWLLSEITTVLKAMIRGDSEADIKALVIELTEKRKVMF
jgi:prophage regulatory protein